MFIHINSDSGVKRCVNHMPSTEMEPCAMLDKHSTQNGSRGKQMLCPMPNMICAAAWDLSRFGIIISGNLHCTVAGDTAHKCLVDGHCYSKQIMF